MSIMANGVVKATKIKSVGRRIQLAPEDRVCAERGCGTKLSRYNNDDRCFQHRPVRYPLVRGHLRD